MIRLYALTANLYAGQFDRESILTAALWWLWVRPWHVHVVLLCVNTNFRQSAGPLRLFEGARNKRRRLAL